MTRKERDYVEGIQRALRTNNWSLAWGYAELLLKGKAA